MKKILNNKSQFGSALTIVPGSSHAKFQYKPLGFEKFAEPLRRMQGYYDNATSQIDDLDFKIKHLPYGTDPTKAKQLAQEMSVQRDELITNLTKSKDYRAASRGIKKLQNSWTNNKNRNALESNYTNWMALDKEQKDRYTKGDITRDQYYDWKQRSVQDFEADGGGTNFEDDGLDGTYNTIGRVGRLTDKTKELRELSLKIAGMTHSEKSTWFGNRGITDWGDIESVTYTKEGKNAKDVAKKVEDFLRTQPDFIKWAAEEAEYDHWKLTNYKEGDVNYEFKNKNYNEIAGNLVKRELEKVDATLEHLDKRSKKDETIKDSEYYQNLNAHKEKLESQKENEYDSNLIQNLHHNNLLARKFNSDTVGELVEYQNITKSRSHTKVPGADGGNKGPGYIDPSLFVPVEYNKVDLKKVATKAYDSKVTLRRLEQNVNNMTNGNVRTLVMGAKTGSSGDGNYTFQGKEYQKRNGVWSKKIGSKYITLTKGDVERRSQVLNTHAVSKRDDLSKSTIQIGARQIILRNALASSNSSEDFHKRLNDQGIVTDKKLANKVYEDLKNTNQGAIFAENVSKVEKNYHNAKGLEEHYSNVTSSVINTIEFENAVKDKNFTLVTKNASQFTKEEIKKISELGIRLMLTSNRDEQGVYKFTPFQYAKFKGYNSVKEAILAKDEDFTKDERLNFTIDSLAGDETVNKESMGFRYVGNDDVNDALANYFNGAASLSAFNPAYGDNWNNQPGFNDEGTLLQGTKIDNSENKGIRLVKQGSESLFEIPIVTGTGDNAVRSLVYVKPKKGMNPQLEALLDNMDYLSNGNSPKDKQTNAMVKVMKFNTAYQNQFITQTGFNAVSTDSDNAYSITIPGKIANKDGYKGIDFGSFQYSPDDPNRFTFVKVKVPNKAPFVMLKTSENEYVLDQETGLPAEYLNPDAAKAAFMVGR